MAFDVVFGWHLDGLSYPETCNRDTFSLGGIVTGPDGLTSQLALRLGITRPFVSQAVRIARYMKALHSCDDGKQFYSTSFNLDSWSTASCLLVMRDQLIAAGWDGQGISGETSKLRSLSLVEQKAYPLCSSAETLREVLTKLKSESKLSLLKSIPIKSIQLVTPKDLLPKVWQEIFFRLEDAGFHIKEIEIPTCFDRSTDLGKIQNFLANDAREELENDGSFYLLEADDQYQLAEVVSAWLAVNSECLSKVVAVRSAPTPVLDAFCNRSGLPRFGGHSNSRWRSALQVLPLMLESCWLPTNPRRTLELIALPESPIPRTLSYHFTKALRDEPGFGGARWSSAWVAAEQELRAKVSEEVQPQPDREHLSIGEEKVSSAMAKLRFWLEPIRHNPDIGMPLQQAIAICRRVSRWAKSNLSKEGASEMFLQALNSAQEMEETLLESGLILVKKIQLDRILDAVAGEGTKPERWHAQSADWSIVDHPGQVWAPAETILWWGFDDVHTVCPQSDPWTAADLKCLSESSIYLDRPTHIAIREAYSWRQALLNAKCEILLCRMRVQHGQSTSLHPLWQELEEFVTSSKAWSCGQAQKLHTSSEASVGKNVLTMRPVVAKSVPVAHRYWSAPINTIIQRSEESATSMKMLFECPMAWVLKYQAKLHPSAVLNLPDGDVLIGTIAHQLFRKLFEGDWSVDQMIIKAGAIFDELVETVGLPLLLRGRNFERENAKTILVAAAQEFAQILSDADLHVVGCEVQKESAFGKGVFTGALDVLLSDSGGNSFIVDYKWNKEIKYKILELKNAQHLQLASYAWLESLGASKLARVGYFMMRQRRLLHCGETPLSVGQQLPHASLGEMWQNAENDFVSGIKTLTGGSICAAGIVEAVPPNLSSVSHYSFDPPCNFCDYGNICGAAFPKTSFSSESINVGINDE